jgi:hypothetical protein
LGAGRGGDCPSRLLFRGREAMALPRGYGHSARAAEEGVALGQEVAIGLEVVGARHVDAPALEALQAVLEHRPVDLLQLRRGTP